MSRASNNGGEDSTRSIVSCKASFAHTRSIVNNEGGDFLIHFLYKKRRDKGEFSHIWHSSTGPCSYTDRALGGASWRSKMGDKGCLYLGLAAAMAIYGKSECSSEQAREAAQWSPNEEWHIIDHSLQMNQHKWINYCHILNKTRCTPSRQRSIHLFSHQVSGCVVTAIVWRFYVNFCHMRSLISSHCDFTSD